MLLHQVCAVRDTGEPHSVAFLRFAKRELHKFTRSLLSALVSLRDASAVPALRNAAIRDMLDWDQYGPWGDVLKQFGAYPNTEVDKALHLRSREIHNGRKEWVSLRVGLKLGEMRGMVPDANNVAGLPKCTNWACDVLATPERPFKVTCSVCNAGFCSQACKAEEERNDHADVCKAGRYPDPNKQDKAETSNQDEAPGGRALAECAACQLRESYPRQFSKCSRCKAVKYCSNACLRFHWSFGGHRLSCTDSELPSK